MINVLLPLAEPVKNARAGCWFGSAHARAGVHAFVGSLRLRPRSLEFVPRTHLRGGDLPPQRSVQDARRCAQRSHRRPRRTKDKKEAKCALRAANPRRKSGFPVVPVEHMPPES